VKHLHILLTFSPSGHENPHPPRNTPSEDPKGDAILLKAAQKVADAKQAEKAAKHAVEASREASAAQHKAEQEAKAEADHNAQVHRVEVILPTYDPDDLKQHAAM
jgi:hypothetical protein